jgi:hypothetical protein
MLTVQQFSKVDGRSGVIDWLTSTSSGGQMLVCEKSSTLLSLWHQVGPVSHKTPLSPPTDRVID